MVRNEESACERKTRQEEVERKLQLARVRDRRYRQKQKEKTQKDSKKNLHNNKIQGIDVKSVVKSQSGEMKNEEEDKENRSLIANGYHSKEYGLQNSDSEEEVIFIACKNSNVEGKELQDNKVREKKKYMRKIIDNFTTKQKNTLGKRLQKLSTSTKNLGYPLCAKDFQDLLSTEERRDFENSEGVMTELKYLTTYQGVMAKNGRERGQWHKTTVSKRDMFGSLLRRGAFVNDNVIRYYRGLLLERELARSKVEENICKAWIYDSQFMTSVTSSVREINQRDLYGYSKWVPGK